MNPILRRTIENIEKHVDLTDDQRVQVMFCIGQALQDVAYGASTNPNFNLKGGDSADENSDANVPNVWRDEFHKSLKEIL